MSRRRVDRIRRLLDIRRGQEKRARAQLASSLRNAAALSDDVRVRSEALEQLLQGQDVTHGRRVEAIADAASLAIAAARACEASAIRTAEEVRGTWRGALRRVEGLERLEGRVSADLEAEERDEARREVDDSIAARAEPTGGDSQ